MGNNADLEFFADTAREMHDKAEELRVALDELDRSDRSFIIGQASQTVHARSISLMNTVFYFLASLRIAGRYP
jgi:hypothetical protein